MPCFNRCPFAWGGSRGAGGAKRHPVPGTGTVAALPLGLHNPCRLGVTPRLEGREGRSSEKVITALMGRDLRLREGFLEEEDFRSLSWGQGRKQRGQGKMSREQPLLNFCSTYKFNQILSKRNCFLGKLKLSLQDRVNFFS